MRAGTTRRRIVALTATIGAMLLTLSACAGGQAISLDLPAQSESPFAPETQAALEEAVGHAMGMAAAPGAIVGVWAPWSGSWVAGVGTTTAGGDIPVTTSMPFRAGDVTRPMICDVLYGLAADGRVALDDAVTKYAGGVPALKNVTLEQLCNGSSGVGSYAISLESTWMSNPARVWSPRELASFGLGEAHAATPGAAYTDADAGYVLGRPPLAVRLHAPRPAQQRAPGLCGSFTRRRCAPGVSEQFRLRRPARRHGALVVNWLHRLGCRDNGE